VLALVTIASLGLAGAPVQAASAVHAPLGYQLMCLRSPASCRGGGAPAIALDAPTMAALKKVNSRVNGTMKPRSDRGADVWDANATAAGDCEDYVLAKRRLLIAAGLPPSALRIAYVKTRSGEGHAILLVETRGAALVLDNLTHAIRPLSQTGYRVISTSGANPRQWS
jgi:predicted transglutaminase-like cysteine proteinase